MNRKQAEAELDRVDALGFNSSQIMPKASYGNKARFRGWYVWIRCDQCEAMTINGIATHETGCINAVHKCSGCNELIPIRQKYCFDCM